MSKIIASAAIRGGHACVRRAETALAECVDRYGWDKDIGFPSTAYALPVTLALTGKRVERLGDLEEALGTARSWLPAEPPKRRLTVPTGLAPASPGDYFDASFDAEEDALVFRRLPGKENWLAVLKACPVSPDDVPRRRRAPARRRKL